MSDTHRDIFEVENVIGNIVRISYGDRYLACDEVNGEIAYMESRCDNTLFYITSFPFEIDFSHAALHSIHGAICIDDFGKLIISPPDLNHLPTTFSFELADTLETELMNMGIN
jgi:hypothetical protein